MGEGRGGVRAHDGQLFVVADVFAVVVAVVVAVVFDVLGLAIFGTESCNITRWTDPIRGRDVCLPAQILIDLWSVR